MNLADRFEKERRIWKRAHREPPKRGEIWINNIDGPTEYDIVDVAYEDPTFAKFVVYRNRYLIDHYVIDLNFFLGLKVPDPSSKTGKKMWAWTKKEEQPCATGASQ